jgi:cell division protein FtsB
LQSTLAKKDFELAKLQQNQSNLVAEISELRRHTKREGVNLDYLKNIVLQVYSLFSSTVNSVM